MKGVQTSAEDQRPSGWSRGALGVMSCGQMRPKWESLVGDKFTFKPQAAVSPQQIDGSVVFEATLIHDPRVERNGAATGTSRFEAPLRFIFHVDSAGGGKLRLQPLQRDFSMRRNRRRISVQKPTAE